MISGTQVSAKSYMHHGYLQKLITFFCEEPKISSLKQLHSYYDTIAV